MANKYIGSSLDDLLEEEDNLNEAESLAIKKVIAWQVTQEMENKNLSKKAMAEKMHTSRSALDRLLDPSNTSVTLQTMQKAASAIGKHLRLELI